MIPTARSKEFKMINKSALAAVFAAAATAAGAADLPSRAPAAPYYAAPAVFTWTGFYAGLNAGVAFRSSNNFAIVPAGFGAAPNGAPAPGNIFGSGGNNSNDTSFVGGGQIGYNWQFGSFVAGVETDFQGIANSGNNNGFGIAAPVAGVAGVVPYAIAASGASGTKWFGTVRGRLGYAYDRVLFYGTGGLAYGGGGNRTGVVQYFNSVNATAIPTATYSGGGSGTRTGFALGAGVEYAINNSWTVKGEYLYVDLGRRNNVFASAALPASSFSGGNNSNRNHVVRIGLNYKF